MKKKYLFDTVCTVSFSLFTASLQAALIDLTSIPMTTGSGSLSFDLNEITVTVSGYHVEYNTTTSSTTIFGPFSTTGAERDDSAWYIPYFGRDIQRLTNTTMGLGLAETEPLGQELDGFHQGIDNRSTLSAPPSFEFALFSFSAPVSASQAILDSASSFYNDVWLAAGNSAPDLSK